MFKRNYLLLLCSEGIQYEAVHEARSFHLIHSYKMRDLAIHKLHNDK